MEGLIRMSGANHVGCPRTYVGGGGEMVCAVDSVHSLVTYVVETCFSG